MRISDWSSDVCSSDLDEAIRMAVERAPMLDARRAQVEAARQESRRAGALPDPMLTVGIDNLPVTGPDAFDPAADFMTMKRIGIRQEIPAGANSDARRDLAPRAVDESQAQKHQQGRASCRARGWMDVGIMGGDV